MTLKSKTPGLESLCVAKLSLVPQMLADYGWLQNSKHQFCRMACGRFLPHGSQLKNAVFCHPQTLNPKP